MRYQCLDCGYKGNQLLQGKCPGCGSATIKNLAKKSAEPAEREVQPLRIVMLIVLWSVLLYKGYEFFIA